MNAMSEPVYRKWRTVALMGSQRVPGTMDFSQEYRAGYEPDRLIVSPSMYAMLSGPSERLRTITRFVMRQP